MMATYAVVQPSECGVIYDAMCAEELLPIVFYDDKAPSRQEFLDIMQDSVAITMMRDNTLLAAAWLRDVHVATASLHFCFFAAGRWDAVTLGRGCLEHIFRVSPLQSLYGVTPKSYRAAVRYISAVGGFVLGYVDGACKLHHRGGRVVPAVVSTYNRKEYAQ